jgi:thiol-disulfide isomerase/thioredoxin
MKIFKIALTLCLFYSIGLPGYSQVNIDKPETNNFMFVELATAGAKIWVEREDGSTFERRSDTELIYQDADGNETTFEKYETYYKENLPYYNCRWRVVDEKLVFYLQKIGRTEKELFGQILETITYPDVNGKETTIPNGEQDILLCFWATWCGPCVQELQILNGIAGDFPDLKIVALTDEKLSEVTAFLQTRGWSNITVIPEYKEEYKPVIQNVFIPACVLISKDGAIQKVFYGTARQMIVGLDAYFQE